MHREKTAAALEPHQENRLSLTKIASGISFWPSRDPIQETGGINVYGMTGNDVVSNYDILGLMPPGYGTWGPKYKTQKKDCCSKVGSCEIHLTHKTFAST